MLTKKERVLYFEVNSNLLSLYDRINSRGGEGILRHLASVPFEPSKDSENPFEAIRYYKPRLKEAINRAIRESEDYGFAPVLAGDSYVALELRTPNNPDKFINGRYL